MRYLFIVMLLLGVAYGDREGGPYVGIGYGKPKYNDDGLYTTLSQESSKSVSFYWGAYMNRYFSVEFDYVDLSPYSAM